MTEFASASGSNSRCNSFTCIDRQEDGKTGQAQHRIVLPIAEHPATALSLPICLYRGMRNSSRHSGLRRSNIPLSPTSC